MSIQPDPKFLPPRVNVFASFNVESEEQAKSYYEELATFAKGMDKTCIISAQYQKTLSPCCQERKP
jgi:hypothetical protein